MHVKGATRESAVIRRMLVAEIWIPSFWSSHWMRR